MLYIEHLTKTFGEKKAVDDLSLHIAPGEIYGFIGHNGAGKRTPAVFTHFIWHPTERSAFLMNSSGRPLRGCCSISLMSGQPSHLRRDSAFT